MLKRTLMGGDQKALVELRRWAEKDNKQYSAAYYTATFEHLRDVQAED